MPQLTKKQFAKLEAKEAKAVKSAVEKNLKKLEKRPNTANKPKRSRKRGSKLPKQVSLNSWTGSKFQFLHVGPAPYDDGLGPGERFQFRYLACSIGRSGANTQTFFSQAPNVERCIFAYPMWSGTTQTTCYVASIHSNPHPVLSYVCPTVPVWGNKLIYNSSSASLLGDCRPFTEARYHSVTKFRKVKFDFVTDASSLMSGKITLAATRNYYPFDLDVEEKSFDDISSIQGAVTGKIRDNLSITVLDDRDMSRPSAYTCTTAGLNPGATPNYQFQLLGAVRPLIATDQVDDLGSLFVSMVVDMYGTKWLPESATATTPSLSSSVASTSMSQSATVSSQTSCCATSSTLVSAPVKSNAPDSKIAIFNMETGRVSFSHATAVASTSQSTSSVTSASSSSVDTQESSAVQVDVKKTEKKVPRPESYVLLRPNVKGPLGAPDQ